MTAAAAPDRSAEIAARDRLIAALDVPSVADAERLVATLKGEVGVFKIGYQLAFAGGLGLARELADDGEAVFLDLKLLDIDNTVAKGVESVLRLGARYLTVHGYPHAMRAASGARGSAPLRLVAIGVLTSLDAAELAAAGYDRSIAALIDLRSRAAAEAGFDAVVCAPGEAALVKAAAPHLAAITPGIRPAGSDRAEQKRAATPADAIRLGADLLVVGRPIAAAADPRAAARAIVAEIAAAGRS
jgi:orotidine-5'-phosphate decarboxylase